MSKKPAIDRRTRILDAAEQIFGDCGFDGASLRQIVQTARVNLATVYYYFDSKESLLEAVFKRRFDPFKEEQLGMLKQAEQQAPKGILTVEKILKAMLLPAVQLATTADSRRQIPMKLIGRIVTEPNPRFQELIRSQHAGVRVPFMAALQRSLPRCSLTDLTWRMELVWGALASILCNLERMERFTDGVCDSPDPQTMLAQMTAFFAAGLRAPAAKISHSVSSQ